MDLPGEAPCGVFSLLIKELELVNYTNFSQQTVSFSPHLNIFYGANAQGKSNLIDSIFFLGFARSHRYPNDLALIRWGEEYFRLKGQVQNCRGLITIEHAVKKGRKSVKINGQALTRIKDLLGQFTTVIFTPDDLSLLKGGPEERRRFLNRHLVQLSPIYYDYSLTYQRILQQRNALLKKGPVRAGEMEIWDEKLSRYGSLIIQARRQLLTKLAPLVSEVHGRLSGGQEKLVLSYEPSVAAGETLAEIQAGLRASLTQRLHQDSKNGYTSVGPHRDDFTCRINGRDARIYASQGQQRTAVLTLKLAMVQLMADLTGEYPVLLLDDVFSELDPRRREYLLHTVAQRVQTVITTTEITALTAPEMEGAMVFHVSQGKIGQGWH